MGLRINTNVPSLSAQRSLGINTRNLNDNLSSVKENGSMYLANARSGNWKRIEFQKYFFERALELLSYYFSSQVRSSPSDHAVSDAAEWSVGICGSGTSNEASASSRPRRMWSVKLASVTSGSGMHSMVGSESARPS